MGRYVLEDELARGAMGIVCRALDPATGQRVALKRLISHEPRLVQMFEREFHSLHSLQHPRIIEVFEYGVTPEGAYYSMELLDGADLRELAPLPFARACSYLRDVASSLGLLHARRMLHRDISPRNVRITSDNRAKLIDFGGMTSFGVPELIVGTPPAVPPEALHHIALDQRTDLFALGALGYYLLTGRHAYPARELGQLPDTWLHMPPRPSEVAATLKLDLPPVPRELDDLVMALLTLNPLGRPASAAEVIDRLEQIGNLTPDRDDAVARSYLLGAATVGRDRERERLQKRLTSTLEGEGACLVIEAESGMGSSRLLSELTINAQLAGALPLNMDAEVDRGAYGVASGLVAKALEMAPADAIAATADLEPILARFSPHFAKALHTPPDTTDFSALPGELRKRVQTALCAWVLAMAARRPLVIMVDNAHRMDEASAALLTTLASVAREHRSLLVISAKVGEVRSAPAAVRALRSMGSSMVLRGLRREEVHAWVRQLFGDVPNTDRMAAFMHRLSGGNPQACMNLAAHLVDTEVVRYIQGSWVLPQELPDSDLPKSLDAVIAYRLKRLSESALRLAKAQAVHRGALSLQQCLALAEKLSIEAPHEALAELATEGIILLAGDSYRFAHDAVRACVLDTVSEVRKKQLHRMLGALLARDSQDEDVNGLLDAGWHLLHGGEQMHGARLLARAGLHLTYNSDEMGTAVPALRAALVVYRRAKRPVHEQLRLLAPLAMAGYYSDRRLADEFGEEALRLYRQHLGLHAAERMQPLLGRHISTYLALTFVGLRYLLTPALGGIRELSLAIVSYISCCTALTGVAAICLDAPTARRRAAYIKQLNVFGSDDAVSLTYRFASILARIPEERFTEIIEEGSKILARLSEPRRIANLPWQARRVLEGGVIYAVASMDAFRAQPRVIEYADRLDQLGLKLYEMVADQLRAVYHALRGEVDQANLYRAKVETHAVQAGSAWQAEIWVPSSMITVSVLTRDTIGLKRTMEQLDRLAEHIPALKLHAEMVRAEYYYMKGDYAHGLAIAGPIIKATADRDFVGRTFSLASQARALNRLSRFAEARDLIEPLIAGLSEADQQVVAHYAELSRELAHAYSGLGNHEHATSIIDGMLECFGHCNNPLLVGNLHATAAVVALAASDVLSAREHLSHMEQVFRPTGNPSLIAQCEHMRREVRRRVDMLGPEQAADFSDLDSIAGDDLSTARSLLSQAQGPEQRAQHALDLLVAHMGGRSGYLFSFEKADLHLIAPRHGAEPHTEIVDRIRQGIAGHEPATDVTVVTARLARASLPPTTEPPPRRSDYRTHLLSLSQTGGERIVGAVAVEVGANALRPPQQEFLQTIARALFEAGDAGKTVVTTR